MTMKTKSLDLANAEIYAEFLASELRRVNVLRNTPSITRTDEVAEFLKIDSDTQLIERVEVAVFLLRLRNSKRQLENPLACSIVR